jgi:phthalate 4,5-cis-dihydrodiol dehydrogenase
MPIGHSVRASAGSNLSTSKGFATRIGVGLIGAGGFGRRLAVAANSTPGLVVRALTDANPIAAAAAEQDLGIPAVATLEQLLSDDRINAVIVATPHATHLPIAQLAAKAGRHIFMEKPLAITVADCRAVIDLVENERVALLVGHVMRLLPLVMKALEILDSGYIGEPVAAWMLRHQPLERRGWFARRRDFGMVLHSPAIHNLDLMNRVLGRAETVTALASPTIQPGVDYSDLVGALVAYTGGRIGSIGATISDPLYSPSGTNSARIMATKGTMAFDVTTGIIDVQKTGGRLKRLTIEVADWGLEGALVSEFANFAAIIRGQAEPFVKHEEALRAVELCEAADRSIASGGTVTLPLELGLNRL